MPGNPAESVTGCHFTPSSTQSQQRAYFSETETCLLDIMEKLRQNNHLSYRLRDSRAYFLLPLN
jgi:hypothetical protein